MLILQFWESFVWFLDDFVVTFAQHFDVWTEWVTKMSPKGRFTLLCRSHGYQKEVSLATKSYTKSIICRLRNTYGSRTDVSMNI